jgi:hypothetical protein
MACPFFMPVRRHEAELWQFRRRLPLGDGFAGFCSLRGESHLLSAEELKEHCNLGYAKHCPWLPAEREADSVRFSLAWEREDAVALHYACERDHLPADCGQVEYSRTQATWTKPHPNACVQRMAECYLESWSRKRVACG